MNTLTELTELNASRGISILLDALVQPRCIDCNATLLGDRRALCGHCRRRLPIWRRVDGCPRCGSPMPIARTNARSHGQDRRDDLFEGCGGCLTEGSPLHVCYTLTRYEGSIRRWIPGFKNARSPFGPTVAIRLAIDDLTTSLAQRVARETPMRPDLIVSIPLHPRRRRQRLFNHVDPIARRIAGILECPWMPDALVRSRDTASQAGLVGRVRRENIRDAFRATPRLGTASRVWLVDDVLTTGSTLDSAANALLDAGCSEVRALTLAATLPTRHASRGKASHPSAASKERSTPSIDRAIPKISTFGHFSCSRLERPSSLFPGTQLF